MRKKALIITWSGFQDQEVIYPYYRLLEDGFQVDIAAEKAGPIAGIFGITFQATVCVTLDSFSALVPYYDLLVLPGGVKALEKLRQEKRVLDFISAWDLQNKVIASTCHGAQLLISAHVVKGREVSGYYSIKDDITNAGAYYVDAPCVIADNLVSSPHYKYMGEWMAGVLKVFYEKNP